MIPIEYTQNNQCSRGEEVSLYCPRCGCYVGEERPQSCNVCGQPLTPVAQIMQTDVAAEAAAFYRAGLYGKWAWGLAGISFITLQIPLLGYFTCVWGMVLARKSLRILQKRNVKVAYWMNFVCLILTFAHSILAGIQGYLQWPVM